MIGVDIIDISRFQYLIEGKNEQRFLMRVFTPKEIEQIGGKCSTINLLLLTGYFAIKEAVIKSSQGELSLVDVQHIEIDQNKAGRSLSANIIDIDVRCKNYKVSLSYEEKYVIAIAIKGDF